jgi:hypothetical protein
MSMPVDTLLEPPVIGTATTLENASDIRMEGPCGQIHQRKKDGSICNGPCDLGFSHYPSDHHCGSCGENF